MNALVSPRGPGDGQPMAGHSQQPPLIADGEADSFKTLC